MSKLRYWINSAEINAEKSFEPGITHRKRMSFGGWSAALCFFLICIICFFLLQNSFNPFNNFPGGYEAEAVYWQQHKIIQDWQNFDFKALLSAVLRQDIPDFNGIGFMQIICALPVLLLGYSWGNRLLSAAVLLLNGISAFKLSGCFCRNKTAVGFGGLLLFLNPAALRALSALDYGAAFMAPLFFTLAFWIAFLYGKKNKYFYAFLVSWLLCCFCCAQYALSAALYAGLLLYLYHKNEPDGLPAGFPRQIWPAAAGTVFIAVGLCSPLGGELADFELAYIYAFLFFASLFIALHFGKAEISLFSQRIIAFAVLLLPLMLINSGSAAAAALGFILPALALSWTDVFSHQLDRKHYGSAFLCSCALGAAIYFLSYFNAAPLYAFNSEIAPFYRLLKEAGQDRNVTAAELPFCSLPIYRFAQFQHGCSLQDFSGREGFTHFAYVLGHLDRENLQNDRIYLELAEDPELIKRELKAMKAGGFTYIILHERAFNIINPKKGSLLYDKSFAVLYRLLGKAAAEDYEPVSRWRWGRGGKDTQALRWYRMSVFYIK